MVCRGRVKSKILVVDDEPEAVELVEFNLKGAGYRPRVGWGDGFATVRMYDSLGAIVRGWARNFYIGSRGRPWRILLAVTFVLACCLSSYAAVAWPSAPQATAFRVPASTRAVSRKLFAPGSRFASGTRTSVRVISACHTARSEPLPSIRRA